MRTICKTVYTFDELSEDAKETAIKNFDPGEYHFWSEAKSTLDKFENEFPVNVLDYSVGAFSRGNDVKWSFTGDDDDIEELSGNRLRTYLINNHYDLLFELKTYRKPNADWSTGRKSRIKYVETCCPLTGMCFDEGILDPIRNFIKHPDQTTFYDLMGECFESWLNAVVNDMEYRHSEEYAREELTQQDYMEFEEDGTEA